MCDYKLWDALATIEKETYMQGNAALLRVWWSRSYHELIKAPHCATALHWLNKNSYCIQISLFLQLSHNSLNLFDRCSNIFVRVYQIDNIFFA